MYLYCTCSIYCMLLRLFSIYYLLKILHTCALLYLFYASIVLLLGPRSYLLRTVYTCFHALHRSGRVFLKSCLFTMCYASSFLTLLCLSLLIESINCNTANSRTLRTKITQKYITVSQCCY